MHFKRQTNNSINNMSFDFDSLDDTGFDKMGSLTENELEFLRMRKARSRNNLRNYAPDPRLGDYET